jgi:hypothetical protein
MKLTDSMSTTPSASVWTETMVYADVDKGNDKLTTQLGKGSSVRFIELARKDLKFRRCHKFLVIMCLKHAAR